ncbi:MAG: PD-(D/E)XK nuclease family protein [bacterium]
MSGGRNTNFWRVLRPTAWPEAPLWMSFSALMELEVCPRRWALTTAEYSDLWNNRGYPSVTQPAALEGTVVHLSLQKITGALVENGCLSLADESAILTLRQLGGYTSIIMDSLARVLLPFRENPRAAPALDGIRTRLTARAPELRTRVQKFLSRIRPEPRAVVHGETVIHREETPRRHALQHGAYTEVLLQAPELGWRGVADMLILSATQCEIRDFKTGAPKEEHKAQLWTYALLWARDAGLNPSGRLADKLVLSYDAGDVEVPSPGASKLCSLEDEIKKRSTAAFVDLRSGNPQARTSLDNCMYCVVRHLCEEYWLWLMRHYPKSESAKRKHVDIQIKLSSRHGPNSWDGEVESGPTMKAGGPILLRTENLPFDLYPSQRLRLLNVYISMPDEEENNRNGHPLIVATMGSWSEVFQLSL